MEGINKPEVNMTFLPFGSLMTLLCPSCLSCAMNRNKWRHSTWSLEDTACSFSVSLMHITETICHLVSSVHNATCDLEQSTDKLKSSHLLHVVGGVVQYKSGYQNQPTQIKKCKNRCIPRCAGSAVERTPAV